MDIKSEVIEIIDELFMEDVSDMMDEDLFDAGVLDSMGTVSYTHLTLPTIYSV